MKKRRNQFLNPTWVPPPSVEPHDFCADYVHDWAVCYAFGVAKVLPADLVNGTTLPAVRNYGLLWFIMVGPSAHLVRPSFLRLFRDCPITVLRNWWRLYDL